MNRLKILMLALITFIALNAQGQMYRNYPKVITMAGDSNLVLLSRYDASTQTWASKRIHWEDLMEVIKDTMNTLRLFAFDDSLDVHSDTLISHDSRINAAVVINTTQGDTLTVHKTKLNTLLDSISAHWVYVANHDDSLGVHNTRLNALIDSLSVHWTRVGLHGDTLDAHNDRLKILEGSGSGAKVSVSDSTLHTSGSYATRSALTDTAFWHWYYISNQEDTLSAHLTKLITVINLTSSHSDTLTSHDDRINKRVIIADSTLHASGSYASRSALTDTASAHWTRSTLHGDTIGVHNTRINARVQISDSTGHSANNYASRSALTDTASAHHTRLQTIEGASGLGIKVNVSDSSGHFANNYATRSALTDTASAHHTRINAKVFASDSTGHSANNYASRSALTDTASLHWAKSGILCDSISAHNIKLNTATNTNSAQTDSLTTHGTKINARVQTVDSTAHSANNYASRSALTDTSSAHWTKITLNTDSIASHNARLLTFEGGDLAANKVNKSDSTAHSADHYASRSALTDTASLHWTRSTLHGDTLTVHNNRLLSLEGGDLAENKVNKVDSTDHSANHYASRSALTDTSSLHWTRSTLHGDTLTNHNTRINARVIVSDSTGHSANNYASRSALTDTASAIRSEHATTDGLKLNKADSTSHSANNYASRSALTDTALLHWTRSTLHGDTLDAHNIKLNSITNINTSQSDTLTNHNSRIMASVQDADSTGHTANSYATRSALTDTASAHHTRLQTIEGASGLLSKVNKSDSTGHSADNYASRSALTDTASTHWTRTTLHGDTLTSHNNRLLAFEGGDLAANKVNKADSTAHSADNYATRSALTDTALLHWTRSTLHGDTLDAHNGRLITLESGDLASNKVNKVDSTAHSANHYASRSALTDTASLHWTRATLLGDTLTSHNTRINLRVIVSDSTGHSANNYASRSALTDTASTIRSQLASTDALKVNVLDSTGHSANNYSSRSALTDTASLHWLRATLHGDTLTAHNIKLNTATNTNASQSDTLTAHNTRINNRVYIADSSNHSANHYASRSALTDTASLHWTRSTLHGDTLTSHNTRINARVIALDSTGHSANSYATRSALTDTASIIRSEHATTDGLKLNKADSSLYETIYEAGLKAAKGDTAVFIASIYELGLRAAKSDTGTFIGSVYQLGLKAAKSDTGTFIASVYALSLKLALADSNIYATPYDLTQIIPDSVWNSITVGSNAENVNGAVNFEASDGDAGSMTISPADSLSIDGFSAGVYVASLLKALTMTSYGLFTAYENIHLFNNLYGDNAVSIYTTGPSDSIYIDPNSGGQADIILGSEGDGDSTIVRGSERITGSLAVSGTIRGTSERLTGYLTTLDTLRAAYSVVGDSSGNALSAKSTIEQNGLGATPFAGTLGGMVRNKTAATGNVGATPAVQQWSPAYVWQGQGYDSLNRVSVPVYFGYVVRPIMTAGAVASAAFDLYTKIGTGSWTFLETMLSNGNRGIGTTAPNNKLDLRGSLNAYADQDSILLWTDDIATDVDGDSGITILPSGNVGIGTTVPNNNLQVKTGVDGDGISIQRNSTTENSYADLSFIMSTTDSGTKGRTAVRAYRRAGSTDNDLSLIAGGNEGFILKASGNVGIGIATPLAQLHTTGTVRFAAAADTCGLWYGDADGDLTRIARPATAGWLYNPGSYSDSYVFSTPTAANVGAVAITALTDSIGYLTNYWNFRGSKNFGIACLNLGVASNPQHGFSMDEYNTNGKGAVIYSSLYNKNTSTPTQEADTSNFWFEINAGTPCFHLTSYNGEEYEISVSTTDEMIVSGADSVSFDTGTKLRVGNVRWTRSDCDSIDANVIDVSSAPAWMNQGLPVDEAYSEANFNGGTTSSVSQDDFYDYNHIADTDDDGYPNKVDLATAGFVKTDASGILSADTVTYQGKYTNRMIIASPGADSTGSGTQITLKAHQNVCFGDACYINAQGEAQIGDADAIANASCVVISAAVTAADAKGLFFMPNAILTKTTWNWTTGALIYLSTAGTSNSSLTETPPSGSGDVIQILGVATTPDIIMWMPNLSQAVM